MKTTVESLKQEVKDQKALCQEIWATASAHIDRTSGKLMDCFLPRCAKQ
jgi:hypothetical protein